MAEQAIKLGLDICNALSACREKNIVHRDIKPANILVSPDGHFKLGDFGIAKNAGRTTEGTKIGTPTYMAPEVYNNQPYGASVDIYSLGMVLYWILNGRCGPFLPLPPVVPTYGQIEEAWRKRFSGTPLPAPAFGSPVLDSVILKACAFNPKDCYSTPEEMAEVLRRARLQLSGQETPEIPAAEKEQIQEEKTVSQTYEDTRTIFAEDIQEDSEEDDLLADTTEDFWGEEPRNETVPNINSIEEHAGGGSVIKEILMFPIKLVKVLAMTFLLDFIPIMIMTFLIDFIPFLQNAM